MDNIILAFEVVFPLMLMMIVGYAIQRFKIVDGASFNAMNRLVFRVFLPLLLFLNIYSLRPEEAFNTDNTMLLYMTVICILGAIVITHFLIPVFVKDKKKISVMIQGIFRSNLVIFGIPIAASVYGSDHIGIVTLMAAIIVPLYNLLAVMVLEYYRGGKINPRSLLRGILTNPLIIASLAAFLFLLLNITIPEFILSPLGSMSKAATPLAFIVLGGTFRFSCLSHNLKPLCFVTVSRLLLFPGLVFTVAIILGFRNEALVALIGAAASPTAVSSFTMALEMDADGELAGQIVIITSIASILTIFMWVLLLSTWNLI